jgi:hypothetical protein
MLTYSFNRKSIASTNNFVLLTGTRVSNLKRDYYLLNPLVDSFVPSWSSHTLVCSKMIPVMKMLSLSLFSFQRGWRQFSIVGIRFLLVYIVRKNTKRKRHKSLIYRLEITYTVNKSTDWPLVKVGQSKRDIINHVVPLGTLSLTVKGLSLGETSLRNTEVSLMDPFGYITSVDWRSFSIAPK